MLSRAIRLFYWASMLKKALGKLKSVTKKNLCRFQARQAIRKGMFDGISMRLLDVLLGVVPDPQREEFE